MIARANLATGQLERLIEHAATPALPVGGQRLACIQCTGATDPLAQTMRTSTQGDGREAQPIVAPPPGCSDIAAPRWSPDGRELAFIGSSASSQEQAEISAVNADGQGVHQRTDKALTAPRVAWSPDGRRLAYTSDSKLFMRDLADAKAHQITEQTGYNGGIAQATR